MSLVEITEKTRGFLKWGGIFLVGVFAFLILFRVLGFFKELFFPTPAPPPQVSFGKLDKPDFPRNTINTKLTYTIDTISGTLPKFPTQVKVFKMASFEPDLLALSKAQDKVRRVGFEKKPERISENVYQWKDEGTSRILTMNILTNNFSMFSNFLSNQNRALFAFDEKRAKGVARDFLQTIQTVPADIDLDNPKTGLYSIKNYSIIQASSLSETQAIKVNFFQKSFNGLPIYYSLQDISPVSVLVGNIGGSPQAVETNFFYQKPSSQSSTYPIKSAALAFEDLKKGNGYILPFKTATSSALIRKISLGFYISERQQQFLLPIIVFEGDNNFEAYTFAIADEWVNK